MILNHKDAIEFLVDDAGSIGFDRHTIRSLHALLADNLLPDPRAAGRLRHIGVRIKDSVFHPLETPALIEECFDQILATASAVSDPFEQAIFVLVQLPYLQPFDDVNKRVSRRRRYHSRVMSRAPNILFMCAGPRRHGTTAQVSLSGHEPGTQYSLRHERRPCVRMP